MIRQDPPLVAEAVRPQKPTLQPAAVEEPLHELLEARLFEALERWITRETLYEDAADELAELRSIASRWLEQAMHT